MKYQPNAYLEEFVKGRYDNIDEKMDKHHIEIIKKSDDVLQMEKKNHRDARYFIT